MSSLLDLLYRSTMLDDVIFGSQIRLTSLAPSSHTEFSVRRGRQRCQQYFSPRDYLNRSVLVNNFIQITQDNYRFYLNVLLFQGIA